MRGIREGWRDGGIERGSKKVGVEVRNKHGFGYEAKYVWAQSVS